MTLEETLKRNQDKKRAEIKEAILRANEARRQELIAFGIVALGIVALMFIGLSKYEKKAISSCMKIHTQNYCEKITR